MDKSAIERIRMMMVKRFAYYCLSPNVAEELANKMVWGVADELGEMSGWDKEDLDNALKRQIRVWFEME